MSNSGPLGSTGLISNGNELCAQRPVIFVILDGVGVGRHDDFDAVARARTPTLDWLSSQYADHARQLRAHGVSVGLPSDADMGNSEVGHNILGAGRIFDQGAKCVETAINSGAIWQSVWADLMAHVHQQSGTLHFIGLLSDGNVHSNDAHLHTMLERAARDGVKRARVHVLLDGRDVPERSAERFVQALQRKLDTICDGNDCDYKIASGGGRMVITMDRYGADWAMVERGWKTHVLGEGPQFPSAAAAIAHGREHHSPDSDQLLPAFVIADEGKPVGTIEDGDAVVLFNYRGDRAIEISRAFEQTQGFDAFDRVRQPKVFFAGMMLYDGDAHIPTRYLVEPEKVSGSVSELLADRGVTQFACAETQKYGHVTYFWNGNRSGKFNDKLETYVEIPSDNCPFNERPWMKAAETTDQAIAALTSGKYRFMRYNYAGGDMVGHTGDINAATLAVESIDLSLARLVRAARSAKACLVISADHGNADDMVQRDKDGTPIFEGNNPQWKTSHTLNPVPFIVADFAAAKHRLRTDLPDAGLANVASTLVTLLGYAAPAGYEDSLIIVD